MPPLPSPHSSVPLRRAPLGALALLGVALALAATPALRADARVGGSIRFVLPHGAISLRVGHDHYHEHRGVYYQRRPHGYVVVAAPRGAVVRRLPPSRTRIYHRGEVYYRSGDAYYLARGDDYVVVDPPPLPVLPPPKPVEEYQSVWVGEQEFQFRDGQFFIRTPEGLVWQAAPLGALAKQLPADAQSIWFDAVEYFESDEVYFRKTPEGYKVVPAPWKQ